MKTFLSVVALAVVATLCMAAVPRTRAIEHISPEKFKNLIVEPKGACDVDFPALADTTTVSTIECAESYDCTAIGAAIGDGCIASSNLGADGGSALSSNAMLTCRAKLDAVVFKLCLLQNDAGTYNLGDAGFFGRIVH